MCWLFFAWGLKVARDWAVLEQRCDLLASAVDQLIYW